MRRTLSALVVVLIVVGATPAWADRQAAIDKAVAGVTLRSAAVYDPVAQRFLGGKAANTKVPTASLMKMLTALTVVTRLQVDDRIRISERAALTPYDALQWRTRAVFSMDDVMRGMMLESSNGAAIALAQASDSSVKAFAKRANRLAKRLGATRTNMVDPSGLDARGQYSTARDLAIIASAVLDDPYLSEVVADREHTLAWPDGGSATFHNRNYYMGRDSSAVGVKNGYTMAAGNVVAGAARRRGRTLIVVAMNGPSVYDGARKIMDAAFGFGPPAVERKLETGEQVRAAAPGPIADQKEPRSLTVQDDATASRMSLILTLLVAGYVFRVRQVRRRRARRRAQRARARARAAALRAPVPAASPSHRPVRTPSRTPSRTAASGR